MDIFIKWNDDDKSIQLPVNPSSFEIKSTMSNTSVFIHNLGEINLKGKRGLYGITLSSFFPAQRYDFCRCAPRDAYDYYITKLQKLYENNTTIHLIITGTEVNLYCTISDFSYGEQEKNGDVQYTLTFTEYRELTAKRVTTKKAAGAYTWKKGDTWQGVTKKRLGSSKTWKSVRQSNKGVISTAKKAYKKAHPKLTGSVDERIALIGHKVVVK